MSKNNERTAQTIRFLKWIRKYPGWWQLICEPDNEHMNFEKMQMLIKQLANEELYEMIFVLLEVHKNEGYVKTLNETLLKDLLISAWKNGNKDGIIRKMIMYLE